MTIRYSTPDGLHSAAAAYVGDTSILESFWRLTGELSLVVDLHIAPPLPARLKHRRELSRAAESVIRTALDSAATPPAPETPDDPRAGSP